MARAIQDRPVGGASFRPAERMRPLLVTAVWLLGPAACATAPAAPGTSLAASVAAEAERTNLDLRAKNAGYVQRIEELENRIFILEDQLDSRRLAAEQKAPATLPTRVLGARDAGSGPRGGAARHGGSTGAVATAAATAVVTSAAPAPQPSDDEGVVSPDETSLVSEEQIDYSGDAIGAGSDRRPSGRYPPRPLLRLSAPEPLPETRPAPRGPAAAPDPLTIYRAALETLRAGHQREALAGFRRFLDANPRHDYADNAQYWIGECYYDLRDLRAAEREFRRVVDRYPRGNKVPDAMLKLGFTLQAEGDDAGGRQVLESLARAFPKHEAARYASFRLAHPEPDAAAGARPGEAPTLGTVLPPPPGGLARP